MTDERPAQRASLALSALAAASLAAAFVLAALQRHPLGDEPLGMLAVALVLAVVGARLRLAAPLRLGIAATLGFPVQALVDLLANGGHTMLPFEFALYAVYALAAAFVARLLGARVPGANAD